MDPTNLIFGGSLVFTLVIIADGEGPAYPGFAPSTLDLAAAERGLRCFGAQLLQPLLAGRLLGKELLD